MKAPEVPAAAGDAARDADRTASPSPSTDRVLAVLETLVEAERPLTLTALAHAAGLPLATCAAIVQALEQRGYATRRVVGRSHFWRPTLRLYSMSTKLIRALDPAQAAQQHLKRLCAQLDMPAHLGVLEGRTVVYIAKAAPPGLIQFDTYPGKVSPFHLTALGRAIAAYLPAAELAGLLDQPLAAGTGPKSRGAGKRWLKAELDRTRQRGYAEEAEEEQAEIGCLAAPVCTADDRVLYSVGVAGFARELFGEGYQDAVAAVLDTARAVSAALGSSVDELAAT